MKKAQVSPSLPTQADYECMILEELQLASRIARYIHQRMPPHVLLEDLVQAGVIGLIDAAHKYDPAKAVPFRAYATFRIRGAIMDSLRAMDWGPRNLRRKQRQLQKAHHLLSSKLSRNPTEQELAQESGLSLGELQSLVTDIHGLTLHSLQPTSIEGSKNHCHFPSVRTADSPVLEGRYGKRELLTRAMEKLPGKEGEVLALHYFEERTLKEIGATLGLGESRVSQIHSNALTHLRTQLSESTGESPQPQRVGQCTTGTGA